MEQNQNQTAERGMIEIDFAKLLGSLWHNLVYIIIAALIFAIAALAVTTFFIKPTYRSSMSVYVNNSKVSGTETLNNGDVAASMSLARTYASILSSRPLVEDALVKSGVGDRYSYGQVNGSITTSVQENTQLVNLYVTMRSPEDAYLLARTIAEISPAYVANIVEGSSMKVVTKPVLPTRQYTPSPVRNMMTGALIGAFLVAALIVLRELTDNRIKNEQELEERFGVPVVGTIPNFFHSQTSRSGYAYRN